MKQYQTAYTDKAAFRGQAIRWYEHMKQAENRAIIHIFAQYTGDAALRGELISISRILDEELPEVPYVGASAAGPIFDGYVSDEAVIVVCTEFEAADTVARVLVAPTDEAAMAAFPEALAAFAADLPELKGVEVLATSEQPTVMGICDALGALPAAVKVFGGLAVSDNDHASYVLAKGAGLCRDACVLVAFSGADLHIETDRIMGWKPIGAAMRATRSAGDTLYELDGKPAYNVYYKYLRIPNDDNIFYNALEFPFEVKDATGVRYLRHAKRCTPGGAIVMSTAVPEGSSVRITYGDPKAIVASVRAECAKARAFQPQAIAIFDCLGRKLFWGDRASGDTRPFYHIADTYGFCALGEIMRQAGNVTLNNLSVIVAFMREGDKTGGAQEAHLPEDSADVMSLVSRLANFIDAATSDLMRANRQLHIMAVTDPLTGLHNRGEIQRRIDAATTDARKNGTPLALVMGDIDDFKHVNDTYGHHIGDEVLCGVAGAILAVHKRDKTIACGRWGGEEFMLVLPGKDAAAAAAVAEEVRGAIAALTFPVAGQVTMSFGVSELRADDSLDKTAIRTDHALYHAKARGKNCVVVLEDNCDMKDGDKN